MSSHLQMSYQSGVADRNDEIKVSLETGSVTRRVFLNLMSKQVQVLVEYNYNQ